jgi:hypothetical protein
MDIEDGNSVVEIDLEERALGLRPICLFVHSPSGLFGA